MYVITCTSVQGWDAAKRIPFSRGKGISTEEYFLVSEEDTAYDINS